jgi:cell wall-associated NlpC family hydrolase
VRHLRVHPVRQILACVLAVLAMFVLSGTHAYADPSVSEIEAQIDKAWNEAEPLIESYNAVHEQFAQNKAKQAALENQIRPLKLQVDLAQTRVGVIAQNAYEAGPAGGLAALLQAGSPAQLADQLSYLDQMAASQTSELKGVFELKAEYDAQKAPIDELVATLTVQDADLAQQRAAIQTRLDSLQNLRKQAYGTSGVLGTIRPSACPAEYLPTKGYKAAAFACGEAGKRYVFGTAGPNTYDCSGLTQAAWHTVGVYLPHNAYEQAHSMPAVRTADMQIGDLVFYFNDIHHVTIYVGDGKVMSAPMSGDVVRMVAWDRSPVHSIGRPG